jgi:SAM-dependent methyltransferase
VDTGLAVWLREVVVVEWITLMTRQYPSDRLVSLWQTEYRARGMPSSYRERPSGSVVWFGAFLDEAGGHGGRALDIGCGRGRNSIYLAQRGYQVSSIDIVPEVLDLLQKETVARQLSDQITPYCQDIGQPWPFPGLSFDVAIDIFCFKHQIDEEIKQNYHNELRRALKSGGRLLLTLADKADGYYGQLPNDPTRYAPNDSRSVVVDPRNGLGSILYTEQAIVEEFKDAFELEYYQMKRNSYKMHEGTYRRVTHLFVLRKH